MLNENKRKPHEYIIFPLDFASLKEAIKYIELLKKHVGLFKVGLELFMREGPRGLQAIAEAAASKIFLDMKFHEG